MQCESCEFTSRNPDRLKSHIITKCDFKKSEIEKLPHLNGYIDKTGVSEWYCKKCQIFFHSETDLHQHKISNEHRAFDEELSIFPTKWHCRYVPSTGCSI